MLILMADTGGGHRASAQALKAGFQQAFGRQYKVRQLATEVRPGAIAVKRLHSWQDAECS